MPSVTDNGEESPVNINHAVDSLERASKLRANQRSVKVSGIVNSICSHAFNQGLGTDPLRALVRIISKKTELDQTSVTTLAKNLYPAQRVPSDVVVTAVGALGQGKGKPSPASQNSLVRWLLVVHEIIEDPKTLPRLYGVLFSMLDMLSIRTSLCYLLCLITRRRNVKPFRIQQLLELSKSTGNEPALQGLLRVYKDYYPDIILGSAPISRQSFPPGPDPEWQTRLRAIVDASSELDSTDLDHPSGFRVLRKGPNRSKVSAIPEVHTYGANRATVTLEEIDNVGEFIEKLERIEPPGQLISVLNDPLLQKYVALRSSQTTSDRIDLWLSAYLEEEYDAAKRGSPGSSTLLELLQGLCRQTQYTKSLLPVVDTFLKAYVPLWDGTTATDEILGLLSYIPLQSFKDAYTSYLSPVERALAENNPRAYEKAMMLYTDILSHWINRIVTATDATTQRTGQDALPSLVEHVSTLSTSLLLSQPTASNTPLIHSILSFWEIMSDSFRPNLIPILLPPSQLVYLLSQTSSLTTFSRIFGIYSNYKIAFEKHPRPISNYYTFDIATSFNKCIRDLFNLAWGGRALVIEEGKAAGCLCHPSIRDALQSHLSTIDREYAIGQVFGISHSPVLAPLAAVAWQALEQSEVEKQGYDADSVNWHSGPVTSRSLDVLKVSSGVDIKWDDYRLHILTWLAERGCEGVKQLIVTTHVRLKGAGGR
ncbi:Mis6-domain-containing protein [Dendryphion nanum]|uniref:Mis6-domain-containing protein n=1 Tax=Dendryphion nanum TaxID=256645 RepID=A0A9P9IF50_9PLEO|nr:Mis6-domain-containing protein [Dendryphion nanum]